MTAAVLDFAGVGSWRWRWPSSNGTQRTYYVLKSSDELPAATFGRETSYSNRADVITKLIELATTSPNVQPGALVTVLEWLYNLPERLPNPFVAVGDDGSISTEWDVNGNSLHVTFDEDSEEAYFFSQDGDEWESSLDAVDKLSSAMRTIVLAASA